MPEKWLRCDFKVQVYHTLAPHVLIFNWVQFHQVCEQNSKLVLFFFFLYFQCLNALQFCRPVDATWLKHIIPGCTQILIVLHGIYYTLTSSACLIWDKRTCIPPFLLKESTDLVVCVLNVCSTPSPWYIRVSLNGTVQAVIPCGLVTGWAVTSWHWLQKNIWSQSINCYSAVNCTCILIFFSFGLCIIRLLDCWQGNWNCTVCF